MAFEAPNMVSVVRRVMAEHPDIDLLDDDTRGDILPFIVQALGGAPWGRKSRNQTGTDLNTDGLTYLRGDRLFEIYDVISGDDGSATWSGYGPFAQGQNGYWVAGYGGSAPAASSTPAPSHPSEDGEGGGGGGGTTPPKVRTVHDDIGAGLAKQFKRPINVSVIEKTKKFPFLQELGFAGQLPHAKDTFHGLQDWNRQMTMYSGSNYLLMAAWAAIRVLAMKNAEVAKKLITSKALGKVGNAFQKLVGFDQVFAVSMDELKDGGTVSSRLPAGTTVST